MQCPAFLGAPHLNAPFWGAGSDTQAFVAKKRRSLRRPGRRRVHVALGHELFRAALEPHCSRRGCLRNAVLRGDPCGPPNLRRARVDQPLQTADQSKR